jgi:uroporphyrinogen-III synthase
VTRRGWLVGTRRFVASWQPALVAARCSDAITALAVQEAVPPSDPDALSRALRARGHDLLLLTSPEALRFTQPKDVEGWAAACVGWRTAAAAEAAGVDVPFLVQGGAADLASLLLQDAPGLERVLFVCGAQHRMEAVEILRQGGVAVDLIEAYGMQTVPELDTIVRGVPTPDWILVGSPRALDLLLEALGDERPVAATKWLGLGATTVEHGAQLGLEIEALAAPMPQALIMELERERHA